MYIEQCILSLNIDVCVIIGTFCINHYYYLYSYNYYLNTIPSYDHDNSTSTSTRDSNVM